MDAFDDKINDLTAQLAQAQAILDDNEFNQKQLAWRELATTVLNLENQIREVKGKKEQAVALQADIDTAQAEVDAKKQGLAAIQP